MKMVVSTQELQTMLTEDFKSTVRERAVNILKNTNH